MVVVPFARRRRGGGQQSTLKTVPVSTTLPKVYEHNWEVGDLVVWDERSTTHRAPTDVYLAALMCIFYLIS